MASSFSSLPSNAFWGPITSNIIFCEDKYSTFAYIAESWNTLTNIPFILIATIYAFRVGALGLKVRFRVVFGLVAAVGCGSFAFHATLKKETQMLDEFPMLFLVGQCLFCLMCIGDQRGGSDKDTQSNGEWKKWLNAGIIYSTIIASISLYLAFHQAIFFHLIFGGLTAVTIIWSFVFVMLSSKNKSNSDLNEHLSSSSPHNFNYNHDNGNTLSCKTIFGVSALLNALAFTLWNIDLHYCDSLKMAREVTGGALDVLLQLHGWWHLLTALGLVWFVSGLILLDNVRDCRGGGHVKMLVVRLRLFVLPMVEYDWSG